MEQPNSQNFDSHSSRSSDFDIIDEISRAAELRSALAQEQILHETTTQTSFELQTRISQIEEAFRRREYSNVIDDCLSLVEQHVDHPEVYHLLGASFAVTEQLELSIKAYKASLLLNPNNVHVLNNAGVASKKMGRSEEAVEYFDKAILIDPNNETVFYNRGNAKKSSGDFINALEDFKSAVALSPRFSKGWLNLGVVSNRIGQHVEAERAISNASAHASSTEDKKKAFYNSALMHLNTGQIGLAQTELERAILEDPAYAEAYVALGNVQVVTKPGVLTAFDQALSMKPDLLEATCCKCLGAHYFSSQNSQELFEYHRSFGEQFAQPAVELKQEQLRKHNGRLRVGYVSPDFRSHSVAYFFESLLKAHNSDQVETFCYYNNALVDQTTERLMHHADHWRSIVGQSDEQVIDLIQNDQINILVDLAGHTNENRLTLFAHKPAPVQVTWLGYPNTTGLDAIDYRFTDDIADPVGEADDFHTEQLIRLPQGMWCYNGDETVAPSTQLPYDRNGFITFGSFNNLAKVTPDVLNTWAAILNQVPGSKLLIKTKELADELTQQRVLSLLRDNGIDETRISLKAAMPNKEDHLNLYSEIDIALDSFPFNGATTTCEAVWMGVPVLTLRGERHVARVGASMMHRIGLENFVAENQDDYVEKAKHFAENTDYLRQLRENMRQRVEQSPLCDANAFAKNIERAFNFMWERVKKLAETE